jgi:hypothetical protein
MKTSHILIGAAVVAVGGYILWSRSSSSSASPSNVLASITTRIKSAFGGVTTTSKTASASLEPAPPRPSDAGIDLTSSYGNESI